MLQSYIVALLVFGSLMSFISMASEINISGTVIATACVVDASSLEVDLGDVTTAELFSAGMGSQWKDFILKIKDCPVSFNNRTVYAYIHGMADPDSPSFFINNGTASNVSIELTTSGGISLTPSGQTYSRNIVNQEAPLPMRARMVTKKGGVMPGSVKAAVLVSFRYN
ncbi:fimbrial protein [Serratia quinivorans]|uniref:fimbrial protein n=1 Tax=Serratia quinivorans TaxID=137545 RepID=UPI00217819AE|nr:fimbrial protein [Serratia quinivorans]CAI1121658.1 long polar fimbrial protein LpfE [Serratia quinivorans]CAI1152577.1 long polar fimbrial protein LpfE [Serratia quinivorans]CAI1831362.1 long polar fimbrial protein LpfE [Serratia quinivorans]CAI2140063.1 long polar fimbrial protein LpfE [Serratia quinivorans]CAI2150201.1 long polar fimbrial protein LpfE [Serratia quinivorans]